MQYIIRKFFYCLPRDSRVYFLYHTQYTYIYQYYAMYFDKVTIVYCLYRILGFICLYHKHTYIVQGIAQKCTRPSSLCAAQYSEVCNYHPKVAAVSSIYRIHKKK